MWTFWNTRTHVNPAWSVCCFACCAWADGKALTPLVAFTAMPPKVRTPSESKLRQSKAVGHSPLVPGEGYAWSTESGGQEVEGDPWFRNRLPRFWDALICSQHRLLASTIFNFFNLKSVSHVFVQIWQRCNLKFEDGTDVSGRGRRKLSHNLSRSCRV